jgi:hypothetical protein
LNAFGAVIEISVPICSHSVVKAIGMNLRKMTFQIFVTFLEANWTFMLFSVNATARMNLHEMIWEKKSEFNAKDSKNFPIYLLCSSFGRKIVDTNHKNKA